MSAEAKTGSVQVLMVCLGNICRSPTAEGVFRKLVVEHGLHKNIIIDSAGTSDWHIDSAPDPRTIKAAAARDIDLTALRGRQVCAADFDKFDYILAMDKENLRNLLAICPSQNQPKIALFLNFGKSEFQEVPDPYSGGQQGFELVLDLVEEACEGLLKTIVNTHQLKQQSKGLDP